MLHVGQAKSTCTLGTTGVRFRQCVCVRKGPGKSQLRGSGSTHQILWVNVVHEDPVESLQSTIKKVQFCAEQLLDMHAHELVSVAHVVLGISDRQLPLLGVALGCGL